MGLEIETHERFRQREHWFTVAGGVLMAALVVGGAVGLFGPGPVSRSTAVSPDGLVAVEYHRVAHVEADDDVVLSFSPAAVEDGIVVVDLTGPWTSAAEIDAIIPAPESETMIPGGLRLELAAEGADDLRTMITYRAARPGALPLTVTVLGDTAELTQHVLP